ncbi:MAG TPA: hypothetical protein VFV70_04225 [Hyphomonadaceae bacterium]|nr:hypothetical protein [Hyphomonadaceae bacterium]
MEDSERLKQLAALSPIQQVALCQAILGRLTAEPGSIDAAAETLDPAIRDDPAFLSLVAEARADPAVGLDVTASSELAKTFLFAIAADNDFSSIVETELAEFRDEKQFVVPILALGLAVSMIIIAATTRFEYRGGGFTISKEVATPELVKNAMLMVGQAKGS